ncbi:MAG: TonB-dependent receptor, partial [Chitinophagaceae bacterium]
MTRKMNMIVMLCICLFLSGFARAQYTQQLRGVVVESVLQKPLAGATIRISGVDKTVLTDEEGVFRFAGLPVGSYRMSVSYTGFKAAQLDNITINAGKETVLTIPLEAVIHTESEIVLKTGRKKNQPLNDMSAVSARAFTVEETQKYAASVNDPLRMATAFPGVLAGDDGTNSIIIRGNSPAGLLWRMEGMDIPNPNHFSSAGSSGGGISILSSQLLANSDFVTAAFAAEYGNALSGVFDLKLRKGNNERKEYTLQAGLLGLNAAAEGPFSKKYKGSYLVNYRYSTLQVLNKLGVLAQGGSTNFQDLSWHMHLPAGKWGTFSWFGFGGLSSEKEKAVIDSAKWAGKGDRYPYDFVANTGMSGITHTIPVGSGMSIRSGIGLSYTRHGYDEQFVEEDYSLSPTYRDKYTTRRLTLQSTVQYRFSNRLHLRAGFIATLIRYRYYQLSAPHQDDPLQEVINARGNTSTLQGFAQVRYKPADGITINAGFHYLRLALNGSSSAEPRFSVKWAVSPRSTIAAGYGLHSQLQPLGVYFARGPGSVTPFPNKALGLTRSHHYVLSYSHRLAASLLLKTELYYQQLFNVPVSTKDGSTFSAINVEEDYVSDPLVNGGKGRNYGVELSLERYLQNNFYLTLSQSLYQSKYTAADGVERNTRFNGNGITTLIAGKDFVTERKHRTFGINLKAIYAGGLRTTPIDLAASQQQGYAVFDEQAAYSLQNPGYFRTDLRVSLTWNRRRLTSTLSLDIQNLTNRLNIYSQRYDDDTHTIVSNYQTG